MNMDGEYEEETSEKPSTTPQKNQIDVVDEIEDESSRMTPPSKVKVGNRRENRKRLAHEVVGSRRAQRSSKQYTQDY